MGYEEKAERGSQEEPGQRQQPENVPAEESANPHRQDQAGASAAAGAAPPEEEIDDGHRLAGIFLKEGGPGTRVYWRGDWWRWNGSCYALVAESELQSGVVKSIKNEFNRCAAAGAHRPGKPRARRVTSAVVSNTLLALRSECQQPSTVEQPGWLGPGGGHPAREYLPASNGLLHVPSWPDPGCFRPHTPEYFSPGVLGYDFDANAPAPRCWLDFLHGRLWPDDPASVACLQEWLGYLLTPDNWFQKILALVGPPRAGKGTIAGVVDGLVGPGNVAHVSLTDLGRNFGLWPLVGKWVAVIDEARLGRYTDRGAVIQRLLSISGGEPQTVDRKFQPLVGIPLLVRFMITCNELPAIGDPTGALASRLLVLRLERSWQGKEDPDLLARFTAELPGILLWALEGRRRLMARGRFEQPASGAALLREVSASWNPVRQFVDECCERGPGFRVRTDVLFAAWDAWRQQKRVNGPAAPQAFGQALLAVIPGHGGAQSVKTGGKVAREYRGIRLKVTDG